MSQARLLLLWLPLVGCSMDDSASARGLTLVVESSTSPKVGETATIRAEVLTARQVLVYNWTVTDPKDQAVAVERLAPHRIRFPLERVGGYRIVCDAGLEDGSQVGDSAVLTVGEPGAGTLVYTAQILPAVSSGATAAEVAVTVGSHDQQGLVWTVSDGLAVALEVVADGAPLPTFVRLLGSGGLWRDLYLREGRTTVRLSGTYDALFVPEGGAVAPALQTRVQAATVAPNWRVALDTGLTVTGAVELAGGPLEGATVTLRSRHSSGIAIPSTLGITGADGAFSLQTRPGPASLLVVPPQGRGLPVAAVEADELRLDGPAANWRFLFEPVATHPLEGTVTRADGQTPLAQARVVLRSAAPLTGVGRLEVGAQSYAASGRLHRELTSDPDGQLVDLAGEAARVPPGSYRLEVQPGDGAPGSAGEGPRLFEVEVDGATRVTLSLARRAVISGAVRDGAGEPVVAQVSAAGSDAPAVFSTTTDAQGRFALRVDSGRTYRVAIRPLLSRAEADAGPLLLGQLEITTDTDLQQLVLPKAVTLQGAVKTGGGLALAQALIRIWCSGMGCPSNAVVDETLTGADGSFVLRVPPP